MAAGSSTAGIGRVQTFSAKRACPVCSTSYAELDPRLFSYNSKHGWCPDCGHGRQADQEQRKVFDDSVLADDQKGREQPLPAEVDDVRDAACPTCEGTRLNATARAVRFGADAATGHPGWAITDIARLSVSDIRAWVQQLALSGRGRNRTRPHPEIKAALHFWKKWAWAASPSTGAPTLSGGEAQRIRLAAQLGSNLQGVCYVLDRAHHWPACARQPDLAARPAPAQQQGATPWWWWSTTKTPSARPTHVIDIGPGAGKRGGTLVAHGTVQDVTAAEHSQTGRYLLRHAPSAAIAPWHGNNRSSQ